MEHEYFEAVSNLANTYAITPSPEQTKALTPHLSQQHRNAFARIKEGKTVRFALPPLRVRHGFIEADCARDDKGELKIRYVSYQDERSAKGVRYSDTAMKYAEEQWGDRLTSRKWRSCDTIYLKGAEHPGIVVATSRTPKDIINDHSAPPSQVLNDAVVEISTNPAVSAELDIAVDGYVRLNCAHCGAGIVRAKCLFCKQTFPGTSWDDSNSVPLPEKVTQLLIKKGYKFAVDPALAREEEKKLFRTQTHP